MSKSAYYNKNKLLSLIIITFINYFLKYHENNNNIYTILNGINYFYNYNIAF